MQQWRVASLYEPGRVLTAASAWPSVNSRRVPNPGMPYLLLPNGAGSIAESTAAYDQQCIAAPEGGPQEFACPGATYFLSQSANWLRTWNSFYGGGFVQPTWPITAFADLNDLGRGRRVNCTPIGTATARGTLCWATTHGVVPPPGQSPDGAALATAAEQMADIKSLNIIITTAQGSFFGAWGPGAPRSSGGRNAEDAFTETSNKLYLTALDNQGLKAVPHACLSCHGGRYDPARKLVVGASLLPLIPSHLNFSSPAARANAEEQIRRINTIILDSAPAPAISAQITALYNGTPGTPGTVANDAAVPAGWAAQPGVYRQVIAPYCGTCHFAQTGPLNFGSYSNLVMNKDRVQRAVCVAFTMPHSEQGLRRFWTEGGPVFLPGLLSTVLGYPKCPQ